MWILFWVWNVSIHLRTIIHDIITKIWIKSIGKGAYALEKENFMVPARVLKGISLRKGCPCETINMCRLSFHKIIKHPEEDSTVQDLEKLSTSVPCLEWGSIIIYRPWWARSFFLLKRTSASSISSRRAGLPLKPLVCHLPWKMENTNRQLQS